MALRDYLNPREQVSFKSGAAVKHSGKDYQVIVTDRRLILYGRRGFVVKNDDVITERLDNVQEIRYREKGLIGKRGIITIEAMRSIQLTGGATQMKSIFNSLLQFVQ